MKLISVILGLALYVSVSHVQSGPVPGMMGAMAFPWAQWLALRPPPPALAMLAAQQAMLAPPAPAAPAAGSASAEASPDAMANYMLARAILPASPKKKEKESKSKEETDGTTTKKPSIIDVGDFWAPPTIAPNVTDPVIIDPAFWAAKKTMFISRLFAALAKQVLNSTGTVTTTTASPNAALLKEIDTVLLSDVARSVLGDGPVVTAAAAKKAEKTAKKESAKLKKKAAKKPSPFAFGPPKAIPTKPAATEAPVVSEEETTATPKPTLDYSSLAKALLS